MFHQSRYIYNVLKGLLTFEEDYTSFSVKEEIIHAYIWIL